MRSSIDRTVQAFVPTHIVKKAGIPVRQVDSADDYCICLTEDGARFIFVRDELAQIIEVDTCEVSS